MPKRKRDKHLPKELLDLIRVTPEQTQKVLDKLKYKIIPLDESKAKKKGALWCCYCGDWKKFKRKSEGYQRCEFCGISIEDFYIKFYNKLFGMNKKK